MAGERWKMQGLEEREVESIKEGERNIWRMYWFKRKRTSAQEKRYMGMRNGKRMED